MTLRGPAIPRIQPRTPGTTRAILPRMTDVYARVEAARRAKMVTVRKVGRKYECYAPGASEPFATKTIKDDACGLAWTYARFKLKNDAMMVSGSVIAEGFEL